MAVLVGQLTVASTEPRECACLPTSLYIIDVGGVGVAECTADVPEVGPAFVDQGGVITHSRKEVIYSLSDSAIGDTPATAKIIILSAVADLWGGKGIIELVEHNTLPSPVLRERAATTDSVITSKIIPKTMRTAEHIHTNYHPLSKEPLFC